MRTFALVAALLLAGCASTTEEPLPSPTSSTTAPPCPGGGGAPPCQPPAPQPLVLIEQVNVDGHVGAQAYLCHPDVPDGCAGERVTEEDSEFRASHDGMTLAAANLTATWTADSTATAQLTLEIRILHPDNVTFVAKVSGPSPLAMQEPALSAFLPAGSEVRAFVYNAGGYVPAGAGFVYATPDQAVHLEGTLTFVG